MSQVGFKGGSSSDEWAAEEKKRGGAAGHGRGDCQHGLCTMGCVAAGQSPAASVRHAGQPHYFDSLMAMGMAMAAAMMSSRMSAQHIHLRVFFCSCLAATRCVVPACTYSTDLATWR